MPVQPLPAPLPCQVRRTPTLDPHFIPARLWNDEYRRGLVPENPRVVLGLERDSNSVSRYETSIWPEGHPKAAHNFRYLERILKFLLWSRGAGKVYFSGPPGLGSQCQHHFKETATGRFDASIMGGKIYGRPFDVALVAEKDVPPSREVSAPLGKHLRGCRIGFDLGASDRKVAAVIDGREVFSEETPWDPKGESDPQWHFDRIMESLRRAAAHLPRVDAIGGSSAGVYVQNQVKVASLFRGVPEADFNREVAPIFVRLKKAWGDIPFEVVNDGEVTALAGSMALQENGVLGIALGSSQAAGFVTPEGNITNWLNELAFAPIDYYPAAPADEWSGDRGCGVQYFSQQCVGRLLPASGLPVHEQLSLPEKLVAVQQAMARGDERARPIYETIGRYLGYTVAHYAEFYDFRHLLILGRVTTGTGGDVIIEEARRVLALEFPALNIRFHLPDEKEKRHGQAIAAASLPAL